MLKWSYLQGLADKGRKFRLELPLEATRDDLKRAIDNYITWYCQRKGIHHKAKLEAWAAAIMRQAQLNLEKGLQQSRFMPPCGYPGLREQITDAQGLLVFAPDDRAPHAIHCSCKMWYKLELQKRLQRVDVYAPMEISWSEYTQQCATFCNLLAARVCGWRGSAICVWHLEVQESKMASYSWNL